MKFAIIFVVCCIFLEEGMSRRNDRLQEFEKFAPYPWAKWLRFHPSSASQAAVGYPSPHRTPPSVLIPPIDYSSVDEDDDDLALLRRSIAIAPKKANKGKLEKENGNVLGQNKLAVETPEPATSRPLIVLPEGFWNPPIPSYNETGIILPGYYAAKKAMFVSKLFEALANVILNTTVPSPTPLVSDQLNKQGSRSVIESTSVENDSSEEASSGVDEETSSAETATEEIPSILAKKLEFLQKLNALISTTTKAPLSATPKPSKGKGQSKVPDSTTSPVPVTLSYEDLAKAILGID